MTDLRQAAAQALRDVWLKAAEKSMADDPTLEDEADAVLAALSASIGEDVARQAKSQIRRNLESQMQDIAAFDAKELDEVVGYIYEDAAPIIALAARDATLEEARAKLTAHMEQNGFLAVEELDAVISALKGGPARE